MDRIKRQAALARPTRPRDDHELVAGDIQVDVLEVVNPGSTNLDPLFAHPGSAITRLVFQVGGWHPMVSGESTPWAGSSCGEKPVTVPERQGTDKLPP